MLPAEAETNKRKLLYLPIDNNVPKYISDPKGTIVATMKQTVNKDKYITSIFY